MADTERTRVEVEVALIDDTRAGAQSVRSNMQAIAQSAATAGAGMASFSGAGAATAAGAGTMATMGAGVPSNVTQFPTTPRSGPIATPLGSPSAMPMPAAAMPQGMAGQRGTWGYGGQMPANVQSMYGGAVPATGMAVPAGAPGGSVGGPLGPPAPPGAFWGGWGGPFTRTPQTNLSALMGSAGVIAGNIALGAYLYSQYTAGSGQNEVMQARATRDYRQTQYDRSRTEADIYRQYAYGVEDRRTARAGVYEDYYRGMDDVRRDRTAEEVRYNRQVADFGTRRTEIETRYGDVVEDIQRRREAAETTYQRHVEDFGIRRANIERDYGRQVEDFQIRRQRIDQDYADQQVQLARRTEDIDTQSARRKEDQARTRTRTQEDLAREREAITGDVGLEDRIRQAQRDVQKKDAEENARRTGVSQFMALGGLVNAAQGGDPFAIIGALERLREAGVEAKKAKELAASGGVTEAEKLQDELRKRQEARQLSGLDIRETRAGEDLATAEKRGTEDEARARTRLEEDAARATRDHDQALKDVDRLQKRADEDHKAAVDAVDLAQKRADQDHQKAIDEAEIAQKRADRDHTAAIKEIDELQKRADADHKTNVQGLDIREKQLHDDRITRINDLDTAEKRANEGLVTATNELRIQRQKDDQAYKERLDDLAFQQEQLQRQTLFGLGLQLIFMGQTIGAIRNIITILSGAGAAAGVGPAVGAAVAGVTPAVAGGIGAAVTAGAVGGAILYEVGWRASHGGAPSPVYTELTRAIAEGRVSGAVGQAFENAVQNPGDSSIVGALAILPGVGSIISAYQGVAGSSGTATAPTQAPLPVPGEPGPGAPGGAPTDINPTSGTQSGQGGFGAPTMGSASAVADFSTQTLTITQFGGPLEGVLDKEDVEAMCAEIVAAGIAKSFGVDIDPAAVAKKVLDNPTRYGYSPATGTSGAGLTNLVQAIVPDSDLTQITEATAIAYLKQGIPVVVNPNPAGDFPGHYMLAQSIDESGEVYFGESGRAMGIRDRATLAQVNRGGGVDYYVALRSGQGPRQAPVSAGGGGVRAAPPPTVGGDYHPHAGVAGGGGTMASDAGTTDLQIGTSMGHITTAKAAELGTAYWERAAYEAAIRHGIDPVFFVEQMRWESDQFSPDVISGERNSGAGAQGIAQMMPGTASGWGVDPLDPLAALDVAAREMGKYIAAYGQEGALVAYNAGPGRVGGPLPAETRSYIKNIGAAAAARNGVAAGSTYDPTPSQGRGNIAGAGAIGGDGQSMGAAAQMAWGGAWGTPVDVAMSQAEYGRRYGGTIYARGTGYVNEAGAEVPIPPVLAQAGQGPRTQVIPAEELHAIRLATEELRDLVKAGDAGDPNNPLAKPGALEEAIAKFVTTWATGGKS
jgi:hypothetical protein